MFRITALKYIALLAGFIYVGVIYQAAPALAASSQPSRVVELFTSQGCSFCPAANQQAKRLAQVSDTLLLSYSVTYWDYLGWTDTFGKPEFTDRQRAYGKELDISMVYTPQMVLNGKSHKSQFPWDEIQTQTLSPLPFYIKITQEKGRLIGRVKFNISGPKFISEPYHLFLVEYISGPQSVPVDKGENRGRIITVTNNVDQLRDLGTHKIRANMDLDLGLDYKEGKSYALLLQDPQTLSLLGAFTFQVPHP